MRDEIAALADGLDERPLVALGNRAERIANDVAREAAAFLQRRRERETERQDAPVVERVARLDPERRAELLAGLGRVT